MNDWEPNPWTPGATLTLPKGHVLQVEFSYYSSVMWRCTCTAYPIISGDLSARNLESAKIEALTRLKDYLKDPYLKPEEPDASTVWERLVKDVENT